MAYLTTELLHNGKKMDRTSPNIFNDDICAATPPLMRNAEDLGVYMKFGSCQDLKKNHPSNVHPSFFTQKSSPVPHLKYPNKRTYSDYLPKK